MKRILLLTLSSLGLLGLLLHLWNLDLMHPHPSRPLQVIAHRGASGLAPENTLPAVRQAIQAGADWIEIDVHLSRDSALIVMHDETVDRCTNGQGAIADMTLAELKSLDAGSWKGPAFAGACIPTLAEVLAEVKGQAGLLIEVKTGPRGPYVGIEAAIARAVEAAGDPTRTVVQSFEPGVLTRMAREAPAIARHKLIIGQLPLLPLHYDGHGWRWYSAVVHPEVVAVNPWYRLLTRRWVRQVHAAGRQVWTYTVDTEKGYRRCQRLGVDGIITNYPARLRTWIDQGVQIKSG